VKKLAALAVVWLTPSLVPALAQMSQLETPEIYIEQALASSMDLENRSPVAPR
jgi:hypothetical protein